MSENALTIEEIVAKLNTTNEQKALYMRLFDEYIVIDSYSNARKTILFLIGNTYERIDSTDS